MTSSLVVDFCGELHELGEHDTLDFGRSAALSIDDNPHLHRRVGSFERRGDWWWLLNRGSQIRLTVKDLTSRSEFALAPGRELALTFPEAVVQFRAGRIRYELELTLPGLLAVDTTPPMTPEPADGATISLAGLPLTDDQKRLILALAEPALRSSDPTIELPSNRAAALRLGWTITRYNRKLDNVCERLHRAGASGVRGDVATTAVDRRRRLVEHAIESGLVTTDDLALLGEKAR